MDLELQGKVAIVGGASQGLGLAIADVLASEGAAVVMMARRKDRLEAAAERVRRHHERVVTVTGDNRSNDDICRVVDEAVTWFGRIDVVVNNDGAPPFGPLDSFGDEEWHRAFERNTMSVVRMIRQALPELRKQGGSIVNVTALSVLQPILLNGLSVASWAAVLGLSKTLSLELARDGIRVNTVCPGRFETPRVRMVAEQKAAQTGVDPAEQMREALAEIPVGRLGDPRELADLVAFLASPRSAYITGLALPVDGGKRASII